MDIVKVFDGEDVNYLSSFHAGEGVISDIYHFRPSNGRSLEIITMQKGSLMKDEIKTNGKISLHFLSGSGKMTVIKNNGQTKTYDLPRVASDPVLDFDDKIIMETVGGLIFAKITHPEEESLK